MKNFLPLILVLILAAVLRFWDLGKNPPGLSWDEAAWGYNAYSLGIDGKDEFGRFLPLNYLESFGDFKPPLYAYLTILPVKFFGLNEFSTRFASAFFGVLTVALTYFLTKEILSHSPLVISYSFVASLLLAISPWHIMLSRAAFEANVATFFLIAAVFCFLRAIRKESWFLLLSSVSFVLSFYTFNSARIVAPFLVIGLFLGFFKKLRQLKKWLVLSLIAGVLLMVPLLPFLLTPQARLRFHEVNIFSDASIVIRANKEMENDQWTIWTRILHNRRWGYFQEFWRHYFDHFNPAFLFIKGDGNPKFSTQDVGELYLWELPFLILGTFLLFRRKIGYWWLIPFWLLLGIFPAATARETPHALRIETTLPTWQIISALGVVEFWSWTKKKKFLLCLASALLMINVLYFLHGYARHYPSEYSREWQYGYKEAMAYLEKVENQYDRIWFTDALGRPYIYLLFYQHWSPDEFRQQAWVEREVFGFVKVDRLAKYSFGKETKQEQNVLYIDLPQNVPSQAEVKKEFKLLNNQTTLVAFEI